MKYQFRNESDNKYLKRYNSIVSKDNNLKSMHVHHIFPRSKFPELKDDPNNLVNLPIAAHYEAHYNLWKYSWEFAQEFGLLYFSLKKKNGWRISLEEENQLKVDIQRCKKEYKHSNDWI